MFIYPSVFSFAKDSTEQLKYRKKLGRLRHLRLQLATEDNIMWQNPIETNNRTEVISPRRKLHSLWATCTGVQSHTVKKFPWFSRKASEEKWSLSVLTQIYDSANMQYISTTRDKSLPILPYLWEKLYSWILVC